MKPITLVIQGRPITKKNHQNIVANRGRPRIVQSGAYYKYAQAAAEQLQVQYRRKQPIAVPIEITVHYWLPNKRGKPDLNNLESSTADILQAVGVIVDDHLIVSWDGSRIMGLDAANPRAELKISTNKALQAHYYRIWGGA